MVAVFKTFVIKNDDGDRKWLNVSVSSHQKPGFTPLKTVGFDRSAGTI
jgi:hypothetical protein